MLSILTFSQIHLWIMTSTKDNKVAHIACPALKGSLFDSWRLALLCLTIQHYPSKAKYAAALLLLRDYSTAEEGTETASRSLQLAVRLEGCKVNGGGGTALSGSSSARTGSLWCHGVLLAAFSSQVLAWECKARHTNGC